ncbi:hypothetical protein K2W90_06700 [Candidatus Babeliales bacterium]|nr:hypothetical protein [Candidatus Babeliales bacterium]
MKFRIIIWLVFLCGPSWLAGAAKYDSLIALLQTNNITLIDLEPATAAGDPFHADYGTNSPIALANKNISGIPVYQLKTALQSELVDPANPRMLNVSSGPSGYCGYHTNKNLLAAKKYVENPAFSATDFIQRILNKKYAVDKVKKWVTKLKISAVTDPEFGGMTIQDWLAFTPEDEYSSPYTRALGFDKILLDDNSINETNFVAPLYFDSHGNPAIQSIRFAALKYLSEELTAAIHKHNFFLGIKIMQGSHHYYGLALIKLENKKVALVVDSNNDAHRINQSLITFFVQAFASNEEHAFAKNYYTFIIPYLIRLIRIRDFDVGNVQQFALFNENAQNAVFRKAFLDTITTEQKSKLLGSLTKLFADARYQHNVTNNPTSSVPTHLQNLQTLLTPPLPALIGHLNSLETLAASLNSLKGKLAQLAKKLAKMITSQTIMKTNLNKISIPDANEVIKFRDELILIVRNKNVLQTLFLLDPTPIADLQAYLDDDLDIHGSTVTEQQVREALIKSGAKYEIML